MIRQGHCNSELFFCNDQTKFQPVDRVWHMTGFETLENWMNNLNLFKFIMGELHVIYVAEPKAPHSELATTNPDFFVSASSQTV
jgi:hypothetical protein